MTDNSNQPEQEGTTPTKPQSRRGLRIVLIIVGLAVLLGGIWWYYRHVTYGQYMQSTDNAYVAADSVVISSKVAGYVEEVFVAEPSYNWICGIIRRKRNRRAHRSLRPWPVPTQSVLR